VIGEIACSAVALEDLIVEKYDVEVDCNYVGEMKYLHCFGDLAVVEVSSFYQNPWKAV